MKRFFASLIFALCAVTAFAQNVKPYTIDLSKMPAANEDNNVTFDKSTKKVTVKSRIGQRAIYLWLGGVDISDYNIIRIKYKTLDEHGFVIHLDYGDDNLVSEDKSFYCYTYFNEMIIPLLSNKKKLNGFALEGALNVTYEQFIIESITLEKVTNLVKTDPWATDEAPVIDSATSGKFDEEISAWDFVKKMGVGINHCAFAQHDASGFDYAMDFYNLWGYEKPTKKEIHSIKEKGFKTIRLCTEPGVHTIDEKYTLDPRYVRAIKQVVDWALEENMYVILCGPASHLIEEAKEKVENDVHYSAFYVSEDYKKKSEDFLKAVWRQYSNAFNNSYDEHLIFQFINEPADVLHNHGVPDSSCSVCKKDFAVLNEYNQLALDTIRSTGGNNLKRFVMVDGLYFSNWQCITTNLFKLPKDKAKDKIILSVHIYPMGNELANLEKYYTRSIKKSVEKAFTALDKYYFSKHIPVYFSEYGHSREIPVLERINELKDFMAEVTNDKRSSGVAMWDDADDFGGNTASCYYNKRDLTWYDTEYIDSLLYAAKGKDYSLTEAFIKKNEVKTESLVGKNLLTEPVAFKNWNPYIIKGDIFRRSTPQKYKIEFQIEKTGSKPLLNFAFNNSNWQFQEIINKQSVRVTGGTKEGNNIIVKSAVVTITIDEELAVEIESAKDVGINGLDIIVKSMKIVE